MPSSSALPVQVLLVEDAPEFAEMVMTALKLFNIPATHAGTGDQAIAFLNDHQPDLILLDLNLSGTSGWKVLEHTKKRYGEHGVPVIITSAYSDIANRTVGKLHCVSRYMVKPFTPRELYTAIDEVLELYKMSV